MEAIADLQHCYTLLGSPQILTSYTNTSNEELDLSLVRGIYHFSEIKHRRTNLLYGTDEKVLEEDLSVNNGISYDTVILNMSKPQKHIAWRQFGSPDAELVVQCSGVETVGQTFNVRKITDLKERSKVREVGGLSKNKEDMKITSGCTLAVISSEVKKSPDVITDFQSDEPLHKDGVMGSNSENISERMAVGVKNKNVIQCEKIDSKISENNFNNEKDKTGNVFSTENESEKQKTIFEIESRDFNIAVQEMKNINEVCVTESFVSVSGTNYISAGSVDTDVKCVKCNGSKSQVLEHEHSPINGEENACNRELINAALVSSESEKRNEGLYNHKLQTDVIQGTEYDKTMKVPEKEEPTAEESMAERQAQRRAALEYVVNATLAHVAYFSESSQEAYTLAKYIEHT